MVIKLIIIIRSRDAWQRREHAEVVRKLVARTKKDTNTLKRQITLGCWASSE